MMSGGGEEIYGRQVSEQYESWPEETLLAFCNEEKLRSLLQKSQ